VKLELAVPHHHRISWLLGILIMATTSDIAAQPPAWTPELMMQVPRIGSVQVSPDGQRVAFTVRTAVMTDDKSEYLTHIHLAQHDGTARVQLTQGDKSCDDPQWSPAGGPIAFVSARAGTKNLWLISASGGEARQLTDVKGDISTFKWSQFGDAIAFTALDAETPSDKAASQAKNDARVVDEKIRRHRLYVVPYDRAASTPAKERLLTPGDLNVGGDTPRVGRPPFDWSLAADKIVFSHTLTPRPDDWTTANLSIVNVSSGEIRSLVKTSAGEAAPFYSRNGDTIAYVASDDPPTWAGRRKIHVIPATGGTPRALADTSDGFGRYSELLGWSADSRRLYYTELQGTTLALMALPLDGPPVQIRVETLWPGGMSQSGMFLNASGTHVGFSWEDPHRPPEAYVARIGNKQAPRVTVTTEDFLGIETGRTEVIRWKSTDGQEIEGLLTYPWLYDANRKYPLLLVIHGGPMGAFTQSFDGTPNQYPIAAFARHGYAVLRANPRGSSGYGAKFRYANYNDWGGGDYQDLMTGVDHVIGLGLADSDRMGVMGWSYGGFMTAWVITHTQRFKAASVGAGVTNLVSFTGTADIPSFLPDYFHGEFWDNLEAYREHSPMFYVKGVRTPTLIQHGERDERVPLSQGQELYNALKRQGCTTKMVTYPRTPHAIEEPRLLLDCMERNLEWFDRYVRESPQQ
jgi:dipeptidyl aminopeptidase/acylaminoacyl peptidase